MPLNNPITPALLADPEIFQQNRLPFHAHFADQTSPEMPLTVSLDGEWAFRYAENLTAPFSEWDTLIVPGFIQMEKKELCQNDTIAPFTFKEPWDVNILPSGEFIFCAESREKRIKSLQSSVKCGISIIRNIALKERSTVQ